MRNAPRRLQEKQKKDAAASAKGPKQSAGELRLQKGSDVWQPLHSLTVCHNQT